MVKSSKTISMVLQWFVLAVLLLQITELFGNPDSLKDRLLISSTFILGYVTFIALAFRLHDIYSLKPSIKNLLLGITVVALVTTIVTTWLDYKNGANFVYGMWRLNYDRLYYMALFTGILLLLNQSNDFFSRWYKHLLFITPALLLLYLFTISVWPLDKFARLTREDNIIEYGQFFVTLCASVFTAKLALTVKHSKIIAYTLAGVALVLFVIAGDEISWGQRIFRIATPESLAAINTQQETTIHNLKGVINYVTIGYIIVGLYGTFAFHIEHLFHKYIHKKYVSLFIPPPHLSLFFFFPFLFNLYIALGDHHVGQWAEVMELLLYSGVSIFLTERFLHIANHTSQHD